MKRLSAFFDTLLNATGDLLLESAVLIFIFALLEKAVSEKPVTPTYGASVIAIMRFFLALGCILKSWKKIWTF